MQLEKGSEIFKSYIRGEHDDIQVCNPYFFHNAFFLEEAQHRQQDMKQLALLATTTE